jgi:hypothetical protein
MAKIHTVEWTPAVISHPTTRLAMNINWWGLAGERITKRFGRLSANDVISGIPGSETNHHGVPYSLTEEFVAVYRMHPLLPDDFTFRSLPDDSVLTELTFRDLGALNTRPGSRSSALRTRSTRSDSAIRVWCDCTTTLASCSTSNGPTALLSILPPLTF